jgi:uncharacterized membrane protein
LLSPLFFATQTLFTSVYVACILDLSDKDSNTLTKGSPMKKVINVLKTTVIGGLVVILPGIIIIFLFNWLYIKITDLIQPLTTLVIQSELPIPEFAADILVIFMIIGICFFLGLLVRTGIGHFIHEKLEKPLTRFAPGYSLIKETVAQFLGKKKSPFSQVAIVELFETSTLATAFVTEEHSHGMVTVFVPTGPNPTSGQIFHLESKYVHKVDVGVEVALRSIISCGAGSKPLIDLMKK